LLVVGCSGAPHVDPAPSTPQVAAAVAPEPEPPPVAPAPPFTAEQLRAAMPRGATYGLLVTDVHDTETARVIEVIEADERGCTIRTQDRTTGGLPTPPTVTTWTWEQLRDEAAFPAGTLVTDAQTTVPAGTFRTRRYLIPRGDGPEGAPLTERVFYDLAQPGVPVLRVTQEGDQVTSRAVLVRRQVPAAN
jgi:hypothetical protein